MSIISKILIVCIGTVSISMAKVTPTDVFVEAKALKIALAQEVIKNKGVSLLPVINIDLKGATPASVYAMGAVLNYKLQVYANIKNLKWKASIYPNSRITPSDVKNVLLVVQKNINNIFGMQSYERVNAQGKKPADVMSELTYANQWLDKLMPFVKPQYPYVTLERTEILLDKITKKYNIPPLKTNAKTHSKITPNDVFINVTSTYNLLKNIKLTYSHQSSPSHPYDIMSAKDKIKPLDIFTITTFNLFFLYTSAIDMGIKDIDSGIVLVTKGKITPNDVFRQADIVNAKLANLIANGGKIDVK